MGESRSNVRSDQYRGELPEFLVDGKVRAVVMPSDSWLELHDKDPNAKPETEDLRIAFTLEARFTWPSSLDRDPRHWEFVEIPIAQMSSLNFSVAMGHAERERREKYRGNETADATAPAMIAAPTEPTPT